MLQLHHTTNTSKSLKKKKKPITSQQMPSDPTDERLATAEGILNA
jgi:hypothetical protein